jgi:hypothetical protein
MFGGGNGGMLGGMPWGMFGGGKGGIPWGMLGAVELLEQRCDLWMGSLASSSAHEWRRHSRHSYSS